jgi:hypothetical protein
MEELPTKRATGCPLELEDLVLLVTNVFELLPELVSKSLSLKLLLPLDDPEEVLLFRLLPFDDPEEVVLFRLLPFDDPEEVVLPERLPRGEASSESKGVEPFFLLLPLIFAG